VAARDRFAPSTATGKRIGYAKLGRAIDFKPDKWGFQGDAEAPNLLRRLARRNPNTTFVLVGRNTDTGDLHDELPNIENPWEGRAIGTGFGYATKISLVMAGLDGMIMQVGQTGTSHRAIPQSKSTWADALRDPWEHSSTPQDQGASYCDYLIDGVNRLGDRTDGRAPVAWLVPDPRSYLKARDIKWPTGYDDILAQYQFKRTGRHQRFRDPRTALELGFAPWCSPDSAVNGECWDAEHTYRYGGLEFMILPDDWERWGYADFHERQPVGIATTSFAVGEPRRSQLVRDYILQYYPTAEVFGKWDAGSLADVPPNTVKLNKPNEFESLLHRWRVTAALPALGSSWTAAKPLQCFAARTVCLHVGSLDEQGWILPSLRPAPGTQPLGTVGGVELFSVRDDWTMNDLGLAAWLRCQTPEEFAKKAQVISTDEATWTWLVTAQRDLLARRWSEHFVESEVERKLGL
jgi:hypothetical protein